MPASHRLRVRRDPRGRDRGAVHSALRRAERAPDAVRRVPRPRATRARTPSTSRALNASMSLSAIVRHSSPRSRSRFLSLSRSWQRLSRSRPRFASGPDPHLSAPIRVRMIAPMVLLERDVEVAAIAAAVAAAEGGHGSVILVSGPAGIGKTAVRLAAERTSERTSGGSTAPDRAGRGTRRPPPPAAAPAREPGAPAERAAAPRSSQECAIFTAARSGAITQGCGRR